MRISDWSSDVCSSDLSSLDFELLFDVFSDDYDVVTAARTDVVIRLFEAMTNAGYDFAYPTQTNFTAATEGTKIPSYAETVTMKAPKPRKAEATAPQQKTMALENGREQV